MINIYIINLSKKFRCHFLKNKLWQLPFIWLYLENKLDNNNISNYYYFYMRRKQRRSFFSAKNCSHKNKNVFSGLKQCKMNGQVTYIKQDWQKVKHFEEQWPRHEAVRENEQGVKTKDKFSSPLDRILAKRALPNPHPLH